MLFSEYLHEKAEESRHNETIGYLIITTGTILFTAGLLETVITTENPEWFLIIPYHLTPHPYSLLGLTLTTTGLTLISIGLVMSIHYARQRTWYMKELHKAHTTENHKIKAAKRNKQN